MGMFCIVWEVASKTVKFHNAPFKEKNYYCHYFLLLGVNEACFQVANNEQDTNKSLSVLFIFEFIQKVVCLKVSCFL